MSHRYVVTSHSRFETSTDKKPTSHNSNRKSQDKTLNKVVDVFVKDNFMMTVAPSVVKSVTTAVVTTEAAPTVTPSLTTTTTSRPPTSTLTLTSSVSYIWVPLFWRECSRNCGSGSRSRPIKCFHNVTLEQVPDEWCEGQVRPKGTEGCNKQDCLPWRVGEWSQVGLNPSYYYLHSINACTNYVTFMLIQCT